MSIATTTMTATMTTQSAFDTPLPSVYGLMEYAEIIPLTRYTANNIGVDRLRKLAEDAIDNDDSDDDDDGYDDVDDSNTDDSDTDDVATDTRTSSASRSASFDSSEFDHFIAGYYNRLSLTMTANKKWFRINDLFDTLTLKIGNDKPSTCVSKWLKQRVGYTLLNDDEDGKCFVEVLGNQHVKGWYAHVGMFDAILYCTDVPKALNWIRGRKWLGHGDLGEVYLVQSSEHRGTNTYKFGMSWNHGQRFAAYGADCIVHKIAVVLNRFGAEKILMKHANEHFDHAIRDKKGKGKEYFTIPKIEDGIRVFDEAIEEIRSKGMCKN